MEIDLENEINFFSSITKFDEGGHFLSDESNSVENSEKTKV